MAKNETPKVTRSIPYRFVCEHCGTQTEWRSAHLTGDTDEAIDKTVLPAAVREANKGNYFELSNISGKCPRCKGRQSWELGEAKAWMRRSPLMGLGVGAMIGGVGAFVTVFLFGLLGALILFLALSLVCMVGAFIYGLVQYISIKSSMKKSRARHTPEVVWYSEQPQLAASPASQTKAAPLNYPAPSSEPVLLATHVSPVFSQSAAAHSCHQCGTPVMGAGAYCVKCGSQIV